MKKVILFFILIVIIIIWGTSISTKNTFVEKIDFNLTDDEIAITFLNADKIDSLLIASDDQTSLLILNNKNKEFKKSLDKFNIKDLYLLVVDDMMINDLRYKAKIILPPLYHFDDIEYILNDYVLEIHYLDTTFCVYLNKVEGNKNLSTCNFIYFYSTNDINDITINDTTDIVFYPIRKPLPTHLLDDIYKRWIETYALREDEYLIIKIDKDDYRMIVVPNV